MSGTTQLGNGVSDLVKRSTDNTTAPDTLSSLDSAAVMTAKANAGMLRTFGRILIPGLTGVFLLLAGSMIGTLILVAKGYASTQGQILAIHLMQIGITQGLALVCFFLGAAMCWFGVTGTFSVAAKIPGGTEVNGRGTHVGMILLVGGVILTALTLQKSASFSESIPQPGRVNIGSITPGLAASALEVKAVVPNRSDEQTSSVSDAKTPTVSSLMRRIDGLEEEIRDSRYKMERMVDYLRQESSIVTKSMR